MGCTTPKRSPARAVESVNLFHVKQQDGERLTSTQVCPSTVASRARSPRGMPLTSGRLGNRSDSSDTGARVGSQAGDASPLGS